VAVIILLKFNYDASYIAPVISAILIALEHHLQSVTALLEETEGDINLRSAGFCARFQSERAFIL